MASRVVYKYPNVDEQMYWRIPWGVGSKVIHVAIQFAADAVPTVWVEHPVGADGHVQADGTRQFMIAGTGQPFDEPDYEHVGSAETFSGQYVWHVYAEEYTIGEANG